MEYQGFGEQIKQTIEGFPYGIAIFPDQVAQILAEQFEIPFEQAKQVTNVNLKRLADKAEITRLQKGIYYREKATVFGKTKPNMDAVMTQILTKQEDDVIGYETGASFRNHLGLSVLMPGQKEIATNSYRRKLDASCHITVRKPVTKINKENYQYLQFLDMVNELPTAYVDVEHPYQLLYHYAKRKELDTLKLITIAKKYYPKKALLELLDFILEECNEVT